MPEQEREVAPAQGERAAMGGYVPQYELSAELIYKAIRTGRLEWIRVADPHAGRVDDVQVATPSRVDAYQFKWARDGGAFTWADLTSPKDNSPPLIAQLADGWKRLTAANPNHCINVHLSTNQHPSASPAHRLDDGQSWTFATFVNQGWELAKSRTPAVLEGWTSQWTIIQGLCQLNDEEFLDFLSHCWLDFAQQLPTKSRTEDEVLCNDILSIASFIQRVVADPMQEVHLDSNELVRRLGWRDRIGFYNVHEFRDPAIPYSEIERTAKALREALLKLPSGYVGLFGTPGSGKSTLLTKTLTSLPYRVIRYYAFTPDDDGPATLRGESYAFLHDLVAALENAGFYAGASISDRSRAQLQPRFLAQLEKLHADWLEHRRKTVILIDGLDHIPRELKPDRSLLRDLPRPEQIPDGIVIVLGSQTDQLADLPSSVKSQLRETQRRIEMEPLTPSSVREIVAGSNLSPIDLSSISDDIYLASEGHPLALALIINQLMDVAELSEARTILNAFEEWTGSIDNLYLAYWCQIEDPLHFELRNLLGDMARIPSFIDWNWIESWASPQAIDEVRRWFSHFFIRESRNRWFFFHNSFRQFLIRKTAELAPGEFCDELDKRRYSRLAALCANEPPSSLHNWFEGRLRLHAGEGAATLSLCTGQRLRSQMLALRPLGDIADELEAGLRIAVRQRDVISMARITYLQLEFSARLDGLSWGSASMCEWLLKTGEVDLASLHTRNGRHLRVSIIEAMTISSELLAIGERQEAHRLFGLAEPISRLRSSEATDYDLMGHDLHDFETWSEHAISFRPVDEVISLIRSSKLRQSSHFDRERTHGQQVRDFQNTMLFHAGLGAIKAEDWKSVDRLIEELKRSRPSYAFWLADHAAMETFRGRAMDDARKYVSIAIALTGEDKLHDDSRIALAELVFLVHRDVSHATRLLEPVGQPELAEHISGEFSAFMTRFRYNRLLFAINQGPSVANAVPDRADERHQSQIIFERGVVELARINGWAWRGIRLSGPAFVRECGILFRIFDRRVDSDDHSAWSLLRNHRAAFFERLVLTASWHDNVIPDLAAAFKDEWDNSKRRWPSYEIRKIIRSLYEHGMDREWCIAELRSTIEEPISGEGADRVRELSDVIATFLAMGKADEARIYVAKALNTSGGVSHRKDHQLDSWVEVMRQANATDRAGAEDRIRWMTAWIFEFADYAEYRSAASATEDLIPAIFEWSPRFASSLAWTFAAQGALVFEDGLVGIVQSALEAVPDSYVICSPLLRNTYFRIASKGSSNLMRCFVNAAYRVAGEAACKGEVTLLNEYIERLAASDVRPILRRGLRDGLRECNISLDFPEASIREEHSHKSEEDSVSFPDGKSISLSELLTSIKTPADFLRIESESSRFSGADWTMVWSAASREWTSQQIIEIAEGRSSASERRELYEIAQTLMLRGQTAPAIRFAKLVAESGPGGWDRWYDGGGKPEALGLMSKAGVRGTDQIAWKSLDDHVQDGQLNSLRFAFVLQKALPLLANPVPWSAVWNYVEEYLRQMFPHTERFSQPIDVPRDNNRKQVLAAVFDLVGVMLGHPCNVLSNSAALTMIQLMDDSVAGIDEIATNALSSGSFAAQMALATIDAVSDKDPAKAAQFKDAVDSLQISPDFSLREVAIRVAPRLGAPKRQPSNIPSVRERYRAGLIFTHEKIVGTPEPEPTSFLPDSTDPYEILSVFEPEVTLLAQAADIDLSYMLVRIVRVMRELADESNWNEAAERAFREQMDNSELRFTFRRPRTSQAIRAIRHVISELRDGGLLSNVDEDVLSMMVRYFDPRLIRCEPTNRPATISGIERPKHDQYTDEWLNDLRDFPVRSLGLRQECGKFVLAEFTTVRASGGGNPEECRRQLICPKNSLAPRNSDTDSRFFQPVVRQLMSNYASMREVSAKHFVVQHFSRGFEIFGDDWLAFNPTLAEKLGWQHADQGLFRWTKNGELMVESRWWTDGFIGHQLPHYGAMQVAEGWMVLATPQAIDQIVEKTGDIKGMAAVSRRIQNGPSRSTRSLVWGNLPVASGAT